MLEILEKKEISVIGKLPDSCAEPESLVEDGDVIANGFYNGMPLEIHRHFIGRDITPRNNPSASDDEIVLVRLAVLQDYLNPEFIRRQLEADEATSS